MRGLGFVLAAILGCAAAVDQCTKDSSGSCCQGYTYNDSPLHKRTTAPVCDGTSIQPAPGLTAPTCDGPPDSNGNVMNPVCTSIGKIPQGSFDGTLYCGNPLAKSCTATVKGTVHVTIGQCQATSGFCFILTATAPPGTTLLDDYKVQISTQPITSDNPGGFDTKVTSQPVYVPFSLVYGNTDPCSTGATTVYIAFHAAEGSQTCWAGGNNQQALQTIPGGNKNWALQFEFDFTCVDVCESWCCCPPPPTIPDCPAAYTQSCPGLCDPAKTGTQCDLLTVANPPGWTTNTLYADKCCCKPADTPQCASPSLVEHTLDPGSAGSCSAFPGVCGSPLLGTIADCNTGDYNAVCCCCTPNQCSAGTTTQGACSGAPPAGQTCTSQSDGCGGQICCCQPTVCTPSQCSSGSTMPGACSGSPPTGQTCTSQSDGCGGQICCCQPTSGGSCTTETAFGVPSGCAPGTTCSTTTLQSEGCNRWGWYIDVDLSNGFADATYSLYAGAGKNDLSKGTDVGSVSVQPCAASGAGANQWCAFFSTTGGAVLLDVHVEADCGALSGTSNNFPCAPGNYNDNGGGSCGSPGSGLPGTSYQSQPFPSCPSNQYAVIFHAAVSTDGVGCSATSCGVSDPQ